tara:strand:- start:572 stop:952 length:381 start_codon:yes stop_codon:yes gene_type:complete
MTWIYTLIGGLVAGIGGTILVARSVKTEDSGAAAVEKIIETITVPAANLTEPDLLEVPCSGDYIELHGEGLCREMFCRMTTRGIDSKTSGKECEEIGNMLNSLQMLEACADKDPLEDCYDVFRFRK